METGLILACGKEDGGLAGVKGTLRSSAGSPQRW